MKEIKVLGTGCTKCKNTIAIIEKVAADKNVTISLEKIEDLEKIMAYDVMSTPAVVVDGTVVHKGSVPSADEVIAWL
ncbi:thioredoxin family protein [Thalassotalea piscium]